jgi:hypothetical protein
MAVIMFVSIGVFGAGIASPAFGKQAIRVTCIDKDGMSAGNTEIWDYRDGHVVGKWCNDQYQECDGQCIGCYVDEDGEEVCYDGSGRQVEE